MGNKAPRKQITGEAFNKALAALPPYEPTPAECKTLAAQEQKAAKRPPAPLVKLSQEEEGIARLNIQHRDQSTAEALLMASLGTTSSAFLAGMTTDLTLLAIQHQGKAPAHFEYNLAIVQGIAPQDELEAMLGAQMAAIHHATLDAANRLVRANNRETRELSERMLNKLARTFATQLEALKRYRSKGEQRVYVERVDVRDGGQAIVGNVRKGAGE